MTQNITRIWTLSPETDKNNLLFSSASESACESSSYMPKSLTLVLAIDNAESTQKLLFSDVKLSIFVGGVQNNWIYHQDSITVVPLHKEENMFRIKFLVNNSIEGKKFVVCKPSSSPSSTEHACIPITAMITFPSGKPTYIASSFLMVTGTAE